MQCLIKRCFDEGIQFFDFGYGQEPYKNTWISGTCALYECSRPATPFGHLFVQLQKAHKASPVRPATVRARALLASLAQRG